MRATAVHVGAIGVTRAALQPIGVFVGDDHVTPPWCSNIEQTAAQYPTTTACVLFVVCSCPVVCLLPLIAFGFVLPGVHDRSPHQPRHGYHQRRQW